MEFETAYAKINLALHVRRRRADGYHDIETVFAFCEDGDLLAADAADALSLTIDGPFAQGLEVEDNLVLRAARALGEGRGAAIRLTKTLPIASGIGGGSADAAAALRLLARLWDRPRGHDEVAAQLGADVPACLASQTMRGEGRGTVLTPLAPVTGTPVLLVNPNILLSTAGVFAGWDGNDRGALGDWRSGRNDLQASALAIVPEIGGILDWLNAQPGVTLARMSGSGATCFALFETDADCARAADTVPGRWWRSASRLR